MKILVLFFSFFRSKTNGLGKIMIKLLLLQTQKINIKDFDLSEKKE